MKGLSTKKQPISNNKRAMPPNRGSTLKRLVGSSDDMCWNEANQLFHSAPASFMAGRESAKSVLHQSAAL